MVFRRRLVGLVVFAAAPVLVTWVTACGLVFPTQLEASSSPDAGGPGATDASVADAAPPMDATLDALEASKPPPSMPSCGLSPPGPPNTMATYGPLDILAALKTVYYTQDGGAIPDLGYDLDCVDTCPGKGSCTPRMRGRLNCDLSGGRDVAANLFLQAFEDLASQSSASGSIDGRLAKGSIGFLLWISDYNGEADDSAVVLATISSTGTLRDPDSGARVPPRWDGNDVWYVDPASVSAMIQTDAGPRYVPYVLSTGAYVTNHTLVGALDGVPLDFFGTTVTLSGATLVATITPTTLPGGASGYTLSGQLVGRVSTRSLLLLASTIQDPFDKAQYLCGSDQTFQSLVSSFCASADIMADPGQDNAGKECDALSVALGFTGVSAKFGPEYPKDPTIFGCDGGPDSSLDCP